MLHKAVLDGNNAGLLFDRMSLFADFMANKKCTEICSMSQKTMDTNLIKRRGAGGASTLHRAVKRPSPQSTGDVM